MVYIPCHYSWGCLRCFLTVARKKILSWFSQIHLVLGDSVRATIMCRGCSSLTTWWGNTWGIHIWAYMGWSFPRVSNEGERLSLSVSATITWAGDWAERAKKKGVEYQHSSVSASWWWPMPDALAAMSFLPNGLDFQSLSKNRARTKSSFLEWHLAGMLSTQQEK